MAPYLEPLSEAARNFRTGIYRHYKDDLYRALMVGRLSEDRHEEMVVYTGLEHGLTWIRPLEMFLETVEHNGKTMPRFEYLSP